MELLKILRSFEEFLFEVMTWLYFYPHTLLRIVVRPLSAMDYADAELAEPEDKRFDAALSPPVLLLISLVLANAIGWAAHIPKPAETSDLTKALFDSQQNLLFFRCLIFSLIPLVAALTLLRKQAIPVARETLRQPFYEQCYLAAAFALVVSLGGIALQRGYAPGGLAVIAAAVVWLLAVQTLWFSRRLAIRPAAALGTTIWAFIRSIIYLGLIMTPVVML